MRIGVIGTGMLGNAVALHLLDTGAAVAAYNRTATKTSGISAAGGTICGSPCEVARVSDIVITVVRDSGAVRDVSFGNGGIVEGRHDGLVVADMSTIDPAESGRITSRFARDGISKIDIPVMGGPAVAISGNLVMMGSGDRAAFDRCRSVLDAIASRVFYVGDAGTAHSVKLAMNLQIAMLALSLAEGITFVSKAGIDPGTFLEILNSTYFKTGMSEGKAFNMVRGNHDPTFTLENMRKDVSTMAGAAESLGIELPMMDGAGNVYSDAVRSGFGGIDYTGIIAHIRKINGMQA